MINAGGGGWVGQNEGGWNSEAVGQGWAGWIQEGGRVATAVLSLGPFPVPVNLIVQF